MIYIKPSPYYMLEDMDDWCEQNCKGNWTVEVESWPEPYMVISVGYEFEDTDDAMRFKLVWG